MNPAESLYRELVGFGFSVSAEGDTLLVAPSSRITDELRRRIRLEKDSLLVLLGDSVPPLLTEDERADLQKALDERAASHNHDGGMDRAVAEAVAALHEEYLRHLMGVGKQTNCCFSPAGRLCPEGRRLRSAYTQAARVTQRRAGPRNPVWLIEL